jgi:arabinofuranosyltransferase
MAAPALGLAIGAWSRRWMSDDGYIYIRVVNQIMAGNGPVFNHGERVEATTSPLWLWLLTLVKAVLRPASTPWIAVVLGIFFTVLALALAQWASYRRWKSERPSLVLPFGAIVVAGLPAFWDYASAGLETSLVFAWLATCFAALVWRLRDGTPRGTSWLSAVTVVLIGLGPLVRPDLIIFSLAFLVAFLTLGGKPPWRTVVGILALAFAIPLAYQVFRMGYYASLVPNPALAKEASLPNIPQGWRYLVNLFETYWLLVPALLIASALLPRHVPSRDARREALRHGRARMVLIVIAAALVHGAYVIYVGGDFMRARMLLPALFALLMPISVVPVRSRLAGGAVAGLALWALLCSLVIESHYASGPVPTIIDERGYYVEKAGTANPVTFDDYTQSEAVQFADWVNANLTEGELATENLRVLPLDPTAKPRRVALRSVIGIFSARVDTDVHVIDGLSLADPVGSHVKPEERGRPGHDKIFADAWRMARFIDPGAELPAEMQPATGILTARTALKCGSIPRLLEAANEPLTFGRFARNMKEAFALYRYRFPGRPTTAVLVICGRP